MEAHGEGGEVPFHGVEAVFGVEDSAAAKAVWKLKVETYFEGCEEDGLGVVVLANLFALEGSFVVPAVVGKGHNSFTHLDIVVNAGFVVAVFYFFREFEVGVGHLFFHFVQLPVVPLGVVFKILSVGICFFVRSSPFEGKIILDGGGKAAARAGDVVTGGGKGEFAVADWAFVEHSLKA